MEALSHSDIEQGGEAGDGRPNARGDATRIRQVATMSETPDTSPSQQRRMSREWDVHDAVRSRLGGMMMVGTRMDLGPIANRRGVQSWSPMRHDAANGTVIAGS